MHSTETTRKSATTRRPGRSGRRPSRSHFVPLDDKQLDDLTDDELLGYIAAARTHRRYDEAARALAILCWGFLPYIEFSVSRKVADDAVERVVAKILETTCDRALRGQIGFDGATVGEFMVWLGRIIERRIADFYRHPERRFTCLRLAEDAEEGEPGVQLVARDETEAVPDRLLVLAALDDLPPHRRAAAQLSELAGVPASEVATLVDGMSVSNVWKNGERFRTTLRQMVDLSGSVSG